MKDRIAHIMRAKNLKASDFATLLGIQPSGISHILSGRNQPSLDFVKKIKETFPEYNLEWIIFGTGPITTSEPFQLKINENTPEPQLELTPAEDAQLEMPDLNPVTSPIPTPIALSNNPSGIKSMVILYEDGTFETYSPR
ncbi:MAG: helix-turn-helix domain-containing protein [Bacteroidales bacterium]|nr:helix-turn-helix domain-containing protein [Bacteroidales bacterium]